MPTKVEIRPMNKKEFRAFCGLSKRGINKMLEATAKSVKAFGEWRGHRLLSKKQITLFLKHNDILPEIIEI